MISTKPSSKPSNPNFSSGPCAKRPGWDISVLKNSQIGRSHRSKECKDKLNQAIVKSKQVLKLPDSYSLAIMAGSNTGALESALWSLLGYKGVDVLAWENFGKDWAIDVLEQLKIENVNTHKADYGNLPDLKKVNFNNDVVFTWNGTTSGVRVPDAKWIPDNREGLTICDATSGIFAMDIDFKKLDVITWSWQKVLGGEAAHGMLALSPRAIKRLETYTPSWPIPKLFRLASKKKLIKDQKLLNLFDDLITYLIIGIIVVGRLGYVIFYNLEYYLKNFSEILMIWNGGMSFHGGLIGIIFVTVIFSKKHKIDSYIFLDLIALVAPIGIFLGRIANFINSELYGRETDIIWSVKFVAIDNVSRHPSQIYEAIFEGLVLFFLLNHFAKKDNFNKPGLISCLFIILYSLFRFILEFFRAPDTQVGYLVFQLTLGQLFSIVFFFLGLFLYLAKRNEN